MSAPFFCPHPQPRRDYVLTQTPEMAPFLTHDARFNLRRIGYNTNARGFVKWLTLRVFQDRLLEGRPGSPAPGDERSAAGEAARRRAIAHQVGAQPGVDNGRASAIPAILSADFRETVKLR